MLALILAAHAADVPTPKTVIGPTAAVAMTLIPAKPVGYAIGVQVIAPVSQWRLAAEVFLSTPVTGFAPAFGADLGLGLVNGSGLGGGLALYGRHSPGTSSVEASTQAGPGVLLLNKVAPTVVVTVPLVLWVDAATGTLTPTLGVKGVLGVPYGGPR